MNDTKIVFATGNVGKMREIRMIMADLGIEVLSMKEAQIQTEIVEDGTSFEENAMIKAEIKNRVSIPHGIWGKILLIQSKMQIFWSGLQVCPTKNGQRGLSA